MTKILQLVRQDLDRERRSKKGLDTLANAMHHHASSGLKHDDSHKNVYEKLHHVSLERNFFILIVCPYRDPRGRRAHPSERILLRWLQLDLPYSETADDIMYRAIRSRASPKHVFRARRIDSNYIFSIFECNW